MLQEKPRAQFARREALPVRRVPGWWSSLTVFLLWALGLFVVALWVSNGGITGMMTGTAGILNELGRLTGLAASYLLLVQVLGMARIPFVERAFGQDAVTRGHRITGFWSFWLMLAHIVLITLGYAADTQAGIWGTLVDFTLNYPAMLLAIAGTLALIMVVVTSLRVARRRMRYESWHLLHLYAFLGVGLALPHQLWTGRDFLASPAATVFWWSLYLGSIGAVLVFRVLKPLIGTLRAGLRVTKVEQLQPGVVQVTATGRHAAALQAQGGQYFNWRFAGPGFTRANPYSLSAAPRTHRDGSTDLRFTAAIVGDGSRRLATLRPGTRVSVEGPYGKMHAGAATRPGALLLGAGIGITPLRALLESLPTDPRTGRLEATIVQRHSDEHDLILADEIGRIADARGAQYYQLPGHRVRERASWLPEEYAHLADTEALLLLCPDIVDRDVYVCGGPGWMDAVAAALHRLHVPSNQIHIERFAL